MYKMSEPQRSVKTFISGLFAVVGVLLVVLLVAHDVTRIPFAQFTGDPAGVVGYNPLFGYISNLGIVMWAACVGVCFLSAGILNAHKGERQAVRFLLAFGGLTAILMLDDLFMFHESLAPDYLNISEKWVILGYGMYAMFCFYHFRRVIFSTDMRFFILAIAALGSSVVVDQISSRFTFPGEYFVEDGLKFIGIAAWLSYFVMFSSDKITSIFMDINRIYRHTERWARREQHSLHSHN